MQSLVIENEITPPAELSNAAFAGFFGQFANYAGIAANAKQNWPVSWMHLSKPTGHYASRFAMRILNMMLKHHAVLIAGNAVAPGFFFPEAESDKGWEQFQFVPQIDSGSIVLNVLGHAKDTQNAVVFEAEPFMVLPLQAAWHSFDDYLLAMQSKYRVRAKKVQEQSNDLILNKINGTNFSDDTLNNCAAILKETLRDKTIAMPENLGAIMYQFKNYFGSNYHIHLYYKNQQFIGFCTWIRNGNTLQALQLGQDKRSIKNSILYQRMLQDLIREGIENKVERINFGRTATEIKSTMGAIPVANSFIVFAKSKILMQLVKWYKKWFYKPEIYVLRNPFK